MLTTGFTREGRNELRVWLVVPYGMPKLTLGIAQLLDFQMVM
jgi:hypothetical protein